MGSGFMPLRLDAVADVVEAEGAWRSPSQDTILLRKSKPFADIETAVDIDNSAIFKHKGVRWRVQLSKSGIHFKRLGHRRWWAPSEKLPHFLPFREILSVSTDQHAARQRCCYMFCKERKVSHSLYLSTFRRPKHKPCSWTPVCLELVSEDAELVKRWADDISAAVHDGGERPRTLLVFLNPFGGSGRAPRVWEKEAFPILSDAGVRCVVLVTQRPSHAFESVRDLPLAELQLYAGIIAVGGDGLFQEVLNGVMAVRCCEDTTRAAAAGQLRLGHIPGGSTDAVAYSLNGTRSAVAAALHVALGDRLPLDVMRVDTGDGSHRFSVCYATYGYMGDLLSTSERMRWSRWLGEGRYLLAGTMTLLRGRVYRARVSYLPASPEMSKEACRSQCQICATSSTSLPANVTRHSRRVSAEEPGWTVIEDEFKSIMAIVTSCRSDMSVGGLARSAHLSDGRLKLILVKRCTILQHLYLLSRIPVLGIDGEHKLPFVSVADALAIHVEPIGTESSWNVDGELMPDNKLWARIHCGAVQVFARGIE